MDEVALIRGTVSHHAPVLIAQNSSQVSVAGRLVIFTAPEAQEVGAQDDRNARPLASECNSSGRAEIPSSTKSLWTLAFGHHEDRTPTHETREAAMAAFSKSWRRE